MPRIAFTNNLQRHIDNSALVVDGDTVGAALQQAFEQHPRLRSYLVDDQGVLRQHVVVFVDGQQIHDRLSLSDAVQQNSDIFVAQALSGG